MQHLRRKTIKTQSTWMKKPPANELTPSKLWIEIVIQTLRATSMAPITRQSVASNRWMSYRGSESKVRDISKASALTISHHVNIISNIDSDPRTKWRAHHSLAGRYSYPPLINIVSESKFIRPLIRTWDCWRSESTSRQWLFLEAPMTAP